MTALAVARVAARRTARHVRVKNRTAPRDELRLPQTIHRYISVRAIPPPLAGFVEKPDLGNCAIDDQIYGRYL
jgi:hypothetical protein